MNEKFKISDEKSNDVCEKLKKLTCNDDNVGEIRIFQAMYGAPPPSWA